MNEFYLKKKREDLCQHLKRYHWRPLILTAGREYLSKPVITDVIND